MTRVFFPCADTNAKRAAGWAEIRLASDASEHVLKTKQFEINLAADYWRKVFPAEHGRSLLLHCTPRELSTMPFSQWQGGSANLAELIAFTVGSQTARPEVGGAAVWATGALVKNATALQADDYEVRLKLPAILTFQDENPSVPIYFVAPDSCLEAFRGSADASRFEERFFRDAGRRCWRPSRNGKAVVIWIPTDGAHKLLTSLVEPVRARLARRCTAVARRRAGWVVGVLLLAVIGAAGLYARRAPTPSPPPSPRALPSTAWRPALVPVTGPSGLSLYVASTEVTWAQYQSAMGDARATSATGACPDCPVVGVSWFDAVEYCERLGALEGIPDAERCQEVDERRVATSHDDRCLGYRLPTVAEWERFANASNGGSVATPCEAGNTSKVHAVHACRANALGLYDVIGNVWEWVRDPYSYSTDGRGGFDVPSPERFLCGGSFASAETGDGRVPLAHALPGEPSLQRGFRVVRTLTGP